MGARRSGFSRLGQRPATPSDEVRVLEGAVGVAVEQRGAVDVGHGAAGGNEHGVAGGRVPLAGRADTGIQVGLALGDQTEFQRGGQRPPLDLGLLSDWEEKVQRLAEASACLPITALSGVPAWMLVLFDRLRRVTGRDRIADVWPMLRLVVHGQDAVPGQLPTLPPPLS